MSIVDHLKLLEGSKPAKPKPKVRKTSQVKPKQPSELIADYLAYGTPTTEVEAFERLKSGDCLTAFCILGMDMQIGAKFNRIVRGRRDLEKLQDDLEQEGY